MNDNTESLTPSSVEMFGGTDNAPHTPFELSCPTGMYFEANAPFNGITIGFPTWSRTGTYCTFTLYKWADNYTATVSAEPLVKTVVRDISDCAFRKINLGTVYDGGEYLYVLCDAGGKGNELPGVWIYDSDVCRGRLYINGEQAAGELQARLSFTVSPYIPFGSLESLYKIGTTPDEIHAAEIRFEKLISELSGFPVSFKIGGKKYSGFGNDFDVISKNSTENDLSRTVTIGIKHKSGLDISLICTHYKKHAAFEWTVYFTNNDNADSEILSDINGCDYTVTGGNPHLTGIYGDGGYDGKYYGPYDINISGMKLEINNETGRSTYNRFPYFNVTYGGGGVFFAVGWPGQWRAGFESNNGKIRLTDGQVLLNTYLKPGQTIRTPLSCFLFYKGNDGYRATNLWRRFYYDCNMRKPYGKEFPPATAASTSWMYAEMTNTNEDLQIASHKAYHDNGINLDYWWMDAGWYYKKGTTSLDVWLTTGSWRVDEKRFPSAFRRVTDYAESVGAKTLLWFEPEVVRDMSVLDEFSVKPEWILPKSTTKLLDIGNPEARDWLLDRVCSVLSKGGISLYRQDYGVAYPATEWAANDPAGQSGIVENIYVQGYLAFFDGIIKRFPDMMLDSCAAGGGRNDLETMRRAVPLHKSDSGYSEHDMKQGMNQSLFAWLPYFGTVTNGPDTCTSVDKYALRSSYCSFPVFEYDLNVKDLDWATVRECMAEWDRIKEFFNDDYYPLTEWNDSECKWTGWEFFDTEKGEGFAEVFRPEKASADCIDIKLRGLKNTTVYSLTDAEGLICAEKDGYTLKTEGLAVCLPIARSSDIIYIKESRH